jgi:hypothetical protein
MLIINCYKITVVTVVFLPVGFLLYKHLLHMIKYGSCLVTVDTMLWLCVNFYSQQILMCVYVLTLYVMSCLCGLHYETVHVPVYVSTGLHTCAVLFLYQRYSEKWVEVRDILFFDQQSFMLVNVNVEIFPAIELCSLSTWFNQMSWYSGWVCIKVCCSVRVQHTLIWDCWSHVSTVFEKSGL